MTIRLLTEQGFEGFFRTEHRRLVALGAAMTGSAQLGEDLAQETLVRAYREWAKLRTYDKAGAWARRVLVNLAIDANRRRVNEHRATERVAPAPPLLPAEPRADAFWRAVRDLPDRQRAVVALHYLEDRSVAEVAVLLDIAEGTVKATLSKARESLARTLHQEEIA